MRARRPWQRPRYAVRTSGDERRTIEKIGKIADREPRAKGRALKCSSDYDSYRIHRRGKRGASTMGGTVTAGMSRLRRLGTLMLLMVGVIADLLPGVGV